MSGGCTGRLLNERLTDMAYLHRPAVNKAHTTALAYFMRSHIHSRSAGKVQPVIAESSHKFRHAPMFRAEREIYTRISDAPDFAFEGMRCMCSGCGSALWLVFNVRHRIHLAPRFCLIILILEKWCLGEVLDFAPISGMLPCDDIVLFLVFVRLVKILM